MACFTPIQLDAASARSKTSLLAILTVLLLPEGVSPLSGMKEVSVRQSKRSARQAGFFASSYQPLAISYQPTVRERGTSDQTSQQPLAVLQGLGGSGAQERQKDSYQLSASSEGTRYERPNEPAASS